MHILILLQNMEYFWGKSSNSGKISLYERKSSELWLVYNKEPHVEVYLNSQQILPVACQYTLSLMNYNVNNQENFQTN